ncbi:MAG: class I SAM-dependent methyltransferase, partial [Solirubrobacteraceae bacterium]
TTARWYNLQQGLERAALCAAIELAAPRSGDVTLDVGTGTGALLRLLAAHPRRPLRAVGVDGSEAMLARVVALPEGWTVLCADARRLPTPDASVDLVTCAYLLHLLDESDRHEVLRELARVLAPGGRAVLVTLLEPRGGLGRSLLAPLQRILCRVLGRGSGWCALDPSLELAAVGLRLMRGRVSRRGYASLCLLVERS